MKRLLIFLVVISALFAAECCEGIDDYIESNMIVNLDELNQKIDVALFYEDFNDANDLKKPIQYAPVFMQIYQEKYDDVVKQVVVANSYISVIYTSDLGIAQVDFKDYIGDDKKPYTFKFVYCPLQCACVDCLKMFELDIEFNCKVGGTNGFLDGDTCVFTDFTTGGYTIDPLTVPLFDGHSKPTKDQDPLDVLPSTGTVVYVPPYEGFVLPSFCLPLGLIFALLGGALYMTGRNPFSGFDFTSPRMKKHFRYSARGRGVYFDWGSVVSMATRLTGTIQGAKATKKESNKLGQKKMTLGQAFLKNEVSNAKDIAESFLVGKTLVRLVKKIKVLVKTKRGIGGTQNIKKEAKSDPNIVSAPRSGGGEMGKLFGESGGSGAATGVGVLTGIEKIVDGIGAGKFNILDGGRFAGMKPGKLLLTWIKMVLVRSQLGVFFQAYKVIAGHDILDVFTGELFTREISAVRDFLAFGSKEGIQLGLIGRVRFNSKTEKMEMRTKNGWKSLESLTVDQQRSVNLGLTNYMAQLNATLQQSLESGGMEKVIIASNELIEKYKEVLISNLEGKSTGKLILPYLEGGKEIGQGLTANFNPSFDNKGTFIWNISFENAAGETFGLDGLKKGGVINVGKAVNAINKDLNNIVAFGSYNHYSQVGKKGVIQQYKIRSVLTVGDNGNIVISNNSNFIRLAPGDNRVIPRSLLMQMARISPSSFDIATALGILPTQMNSLEASFDMVMQKQKIAQNIGRLGSVLNQLQAGNLEYKGVNEKGALEKATTNTSLMNHVMKASIAVFDTNTLIDGIGIRGESAEAIGALRSDIGAKVVSTQRNFFMSAQRNASLDVAKAEAGYALFKCDPNAVLPSDPNILITKIEKQDEQLRKIREVSEYYSKDGIGIGTKVKIKELDGETQVLQGEDWIKLSVLPTDQQLSIAEKADLFMQGKTTATRAYASENGIAIDDVQKLRNNNGQSEILRGENWIPIFNLPMKEQAEINRKASAFLAANVPELRTYNTKTGMNVSGIGTVRQVDGGEIEMKKRKVWVPLSSLPEERQIQTHQDLITFLGYNADIIRTENMKDNYQSLLNDPAAQTEHLTKIYETLTQTYTAVSSTMGGEDAKLSAKTINNMFTASTDQKSINKLPDYLEAIGTELYSAETPAKGIISKIKSAFESGNDILIKKMEYEHQVTDNVQSMIFKTALHDDPEKVRELLFKPDTLAQDEPELKDWAKRPQITEAWQNHQDYPSQLTEQKLVEAVAKYAPDKSLNEFLGLKISDQPKTPTQIRIDNAQAISLSGMASVQPERLTQFIHNHVKKQSEWTKTPEFQQAMELYNKTNDLKPVADAIAYKAPDSLVTDLIGKDLPKEEIKNTDQQLSIAGILEHNSALVTSFLKRQKAQWAKDPEIKQGITDYVNHGNAETLSTALATKAPDTVVDNFISKANSIIRTVANPEEIKDTQYKKLKLLEIASSDPMFIPDYMIKSRKEKWAQIPEVQEGLKKLNEPRKEMSNEPIIQLMDAIAHHTPNEEFQNLTSTYYQGTIDKKQETYLADKMKFDPDQTVKFVKDYVKDAKQKETEVRREITDAWKEYQKTKDPVLLANAFAYFADDKTVDKFLQQSHHTTGTSRSFDSSPTKEISQKTKELLSPSFELPEAPKTVDNTPKPTDSHVEKVRKGFTHLKDSVTRARNEFDKQSTPIKPSKPIEIVAPKVEGDDLMEKQDDERRDREQTKKGKRRKSDEKES